jgi:hypothetical protein
MQSIAFDADGTGWVAESGLNQVVEFTAARILSAPVPHGLAFDNNGSVWVSNSVHAAIDVHSASTLTSGTAALIQRITTGSGAGCSLFDGQGCVRSVDRAGARAMIHALRNGCSFLTVANATTAPAAQSPAEMIIARA